MHGESQRSQVARLRLRQLTLPAARAGGARRRPPNALRSTRRRRRQGRSRRANLDNRRVVRRQIQRRACGRKRGSSAPPIQKRACRCTCTLATARRATRAITPSGGARSTGALDAVKQTRKPMDSWRTSNARSASSQQRFSLTAANRSRESRHHADRADRDAEHARHTMADHAIRLRPAPTEDLPNPAWSRRLKNTDATTLRQMRRPLALSAVRTNCRVYWLRPDGPGRRDRGNLEPAAAPRGGSIPMTRALMLVQSVSGSISGLVMVAGASSCLTFSAARRRRRQLVRANGGGARQAAWPRRASRRATCARPRARNRDRRHPRARPRSACPRVRLLSRGATNLDALAIALSYR